MDDADTKENESLTAKLIVDYLEIHMRISNSDNTKGRLWTRNNCN